MHVLFYHCSTRSKKKTNRNFNTSQTNTYIKKNLTMILYHNQNQNQKKHPKRFYQKYLELRRRINAHSYPVSPATLNTGIIGVNSTYTIAPTTSTTTTTNNFTVQRSASLKDYKPLRYETHNLAENLINLPKYSLFFFLSFIYYFNCFLIFFSF